MAVMSGNVNVTVRVDGVGSAPSKVEDTKKAIKSLGDESQRSGNAVASLKERMGALKTSVGPINAVRETFENLRGNLGLVGIAVAGLITVFTALIDVLDTPRIDATVERFTNLSRAISSSTKELAGLLTQASALGSALASVDSEIAEIDADVAEREGRWKDALELRERAGKARSADRIREQEDKLAEADTLANTAEEGVRKARAEKREIDVEVAHLTQLIAMRRGQGLSTQRQEEQLIAVRVAQGGVITNLRLAETAYDESARAVDRYSRKLAALDRQLDSLDKPAAERPKGDKGGGGGGGRKDIDWDKRFEEEVRSQEIAAERARLRLEKMKPLPEPGVPLNRQSFGGAGESQTSEITRSDGHLRGLKRRRGMAEDVRDFSAALSESIPGLSEFSGALGDIANSWGDVAAANDNAATVYQSYLSGRATEAEYLKAAKDARTAEARGAISSIGAIAAAGAEQIKNERVRAGVLSTIHFGLGTALMFVPGAQQEAIGHLSGAAILAGVAIFGGASRGSGAGRSSSSRSVARPLSERTASGALTINIFGGWFGTANPQETAAALHALTRRGGGSGYVPMPRAA